MQERNKTDRRVDTRQGAHKDQLSCVVQLRKAKHPQDKVQGERDFTKENVLTTLNPDSQLSKRIRFRNHALSCNRGPHNPCHRLLKTKSHMMLYFRILIDHMLKQLMVPCFQHPRQVRGNDKFFSIGWSRYGKIVDENKFYPNTLIQTF